MGNCRRCGQCDDRKAHKIYWITIEAYLHQAQKASMKKEKK
jgi:hypothetical protein